MTQQTAKVFERQQTVDSWDRDYYHPIAERLYDRAISSMLQLMGAKPGELVLDAGCGPGVHSIRAARGGCHVCAIDISQTMLDQAAKRIASAGFASRVKLQQEDLTKLTLADATFRHVFSWGVLVHIHDAAKALDELARVTAPGGSLALYLTNETAVDQTIESVARSLLRKPLAKVRQPLGDGTWYDMHGEKLWVRQFNIPAVIQHIESRGFRLVRRRAVEFSELQRRVPNALRTPLLRLNNAWFRLNLPARPATGNLLVFQKR